MEEENIIRISHPIGDYNSTALSKLLDEDMLKEHGKKLGTVQIQIMNGRLIPYLPSKGEIKSIRRAVDNAKHFKIPIEYLNTFGVYELFLPTLYKAVLIEFVGTATFVYIHIAIVLTSQNFSYPPVAIAILHAIMVCFFILQFAMSSGGHMNSLLTISTVFTGHTPLVRGVLYVLVQVLGAYLGAQVMRGSITEDSINTIGFGGCNSGDLSGRQALAIEFVFSLTILYIAYGTALNLKQREIFGPVLPPIFIGITVGLVIFSSSALSTPPFTGAGGNPSMCQGIAWAARSVRNASVPRKQWVYWVGPILASIANGLLYCFAPPHHHLSFTDDVQTKSDPTEVKLKSNNKEENNITNVTSISSINL
eukprot:gene14808-19894_t